MSKWTHVKVVYISDVFSSLTKGNVYQAKFLGNNNIYTVVNDLGNTLCYYKGHFHTIKQHRSIKLEDILNEVST